MRPEAGELGERLGIEAGAAGGGIEIGREREAHPDQERAQGHQRPVGDDPLTPWPRDRHPPQQVQLVLDGDQEEDAGRADADDADRGGLRRRRGEILEPPGRLLADLRHEITEDKGQQILPQRREIGKRRQDAEGDDAERHERHERGIAERARRDEAAVAVEAVQRVPAKRHGRREPGPQRTGDGGHRAVRRVVRPGAARDAAPDAGGAAVSTLLHQLPIRPFCPHKQARRVGHGRLAMRANGRGQPPARGLLVIVHLTLWVDSRP